MAYRFPPQTWRLIANEEGSVELFRSAGLRDIKVGIKNAGYFLRDSLEWWDVVWNAGFRRMVSQVSPEKQEEFKREHLCEVDHLATGSGIWLDVGFLITSGIKL